MNISDIKTVSELVEANKEVTPMEAAVAALKECGYEDSKVIVTWLLTNMLDFHKTSAVDCLKGESEGSPLAWAHDAGKLEAILETLKSID